MMVMVTENATKIILSMADGFTLERGLADGMAAGKDEKY